MKKLVLLACSALLLASCGETAAPVVEVKSLAEMTEDFNAQVKALYEDSTLTREEISAKYDELLNASYEAHKADSLGMTQFVSLMLDAWDYQTLQQKYAEADTLTQNNARVQHYMEVLGNYQKVLPGAQYIDIVGPEVRTNEEISVAKVLAEGKPVLLDFFASWCPPCKRAIKNEFPELVKQAEGKMNILGIDVWEDKREDIDKAMTELPITWRVLVAGGRQNSPADTWGVTSIPSLVLLSADGTILARGHALEEIQEELDKILK